MATAAFVVTVLAVLYLALRWGLAFLMTARSS